MTFGNKELNLNKGSESCSERRFCLFEETEEGGGGEEQFNFKEERNEKEERK